MGAFKIDWALSTPVPWKAQECMQAATIHLGATAREIASSERAAWRGYLARKPFVLVVQPSLFDSTRAPRGKHTLWGYCHVPNACDTDMTERIEAQMERFAPSFCDTILARSVAPPAELERHNANLSVATSMAGRRISPNCFFDRRSDCIRRRSADSIFARLQHRPAVKCMECAATLRRKERCGNGSSLPKGSWFQDDLDDGWARPASCYFSACEPMTPRLVLSLGRSRLRDLLQSLASHLPVPGVNGDITEADDADQTFVHV